MNKIVALNICLLPDEKTNKILQYNYNQELSQYTSEGFEYIPHVSLGMLFIQEAMLEELKNELSQLEIHKIECDNSYEIRKGNLFWVSLKRNDLVNTAQENILKIIQKYKQSWYKDSFLLKDFHYENNIVWVEEFEKNNNFENNLHITLWKNEPKQFDLSLLWENILFPNLALGQMWNFCAVRKIYHTIPLK